MHRGLIFERLDRAFCNPEWNALFPDSSVQHLPRSRFDHCPILVSLTTPSHFGKLFRFENFLLHYRSFEEVVANSWNTNDNLVSLRISLTQ